MTIINDLNEISAQIRLHALRMIHLAGSGHPGGSLSCADILSCLYFSEMNIRPSEPNWPNRDRFILSKGHAAPAYYAALGIRGYFDKIEFESFRKSHGLLQGHPDVRIPGVDAPSGSLGMGLSQGLGMALSARAHNMDYRTFVLLGDGDLQEGNTWEGLMAAGFYKVSNLIAILDMNSLQGDGPVVNQMDYNPLSEKIKSFNWSFKTIDGHDNESITKTISDITNDQESPVFIAAKTIKGKGISFMENDNSWHGSRGLTNEEYRIVCEELKVK